MTNSKQEAYDVLHELNTKEGWEEFVLISEMEKLRQERCVAG